jgi:hypothetical protein
MSITPHGNGCLRGRRLDRSRTRRRRGGWGGVGDDPSRPLRTLVPAQVVRLEDRTLLAIAPPVGIATFVSTQNNEAASTSITVPLTQPVAVGNTVLVTVAMDPTAGAVSATDSKGNAYQLDADVTNGSGTEGVRTLVFSAPVTAALTTSDTITVNFPTTVAKTVSAVKVAGLVAANRVDRVSTNGASGPTPSSGATAPTSQPDELLLGVVGNEVGAGQTFSAGGGFTALPRGTSGAGVVSTLHVSVFPEYRIVTGAGSYTASGTLSYNGPPGPTQWSAAVVTYRVAVPTVVSIERAASSSNPTNAGSVPFTVTFSEPVTGVDAGDFQVAGSGVSGATVGTVSGGGNVYTVTVNTGSGDGTVGLNLIDNDTIRDSDLNPLGGTGTGNGSFTTGQVFTIDKTAPAVTQVLVHWGTSQVFDVTTLPLVDGSPRTLPWFNVSQIDVVFSEDVVGATPSNLTLTATTASASGFSYTSSTHTATWSTLGLTPSGIDRIILFVNGSSPNGVHDASGNFLAGGNFTRTYFTLPGDFNGDGTVTINDAVGVRDQIGQPINPSNIWADMDGDGDIDVTDYNLSRSRIRTTKVAAAAT